MKEVFDKREAAEFLCVSIETVDRYRKMGKLNFRKIGRRVVCTRNDLISFLDACLVPATVIPTDREKLETAKAVAKGEI